jgi:ankyrin repeat protein
LNKPSELDLDLGAAISNSDLETASRLLKQGADINRIIATTVPDERGIYDDTTTYLIEASTRGNIETVRFLLERGADPNIAGSFASQTALLAATQMGHSGVAELLLQHGADWAAVDYPSKFSAMEYAVSRENAAIVRSLLAAGARPTCRRLSFDRDGDAAAREIVRLLMDYGFDINKRDDWGRTPIMWAVQRAPLETVKFLIDAGADVNIISGKNMNGVSSNESALKLATKAKRKDVEALLSRNGAVR